MENSIYHSELLYNCFKKLSLGIVGKKLLKVKTSKSPINQGFHHFGLSGNFSTIPYAKSFHRRP